MLTGHEPKENMAPGGAQRALVWLKMEGKEEMARSEAENQQEWIINSLWTDLKMYGIILKI